MLAVPSDPDTTVANLAQAPKGSLLDDSPAEYVQLAEDAVAVSRPTPARLDGLAATRYQVLVDGSKTSPDLLGSLPNSQVEPLPVDVYLDAQGRLVRVTTSTTVGGKPASLVLRFSRFNSPIRIAAPSGQVVGPS